MLVDDAARFISWKCSAEEREVIMPLLIRNRWAPNRWSERFVGRPMHPDQLARYGYGECPP